MESNFKKKPRDREFFACSICPNRVFYNGKSSQIHMHEHHGGSIISEPSQSLANKDYNSSGAEKVEEQVLTDGTHIQTNQNINQNWQFFSPDEVQKTYNGIYRIRLPKVETFLEMSYVTPTWVCKLCSTDSFNDKHTAEQHIKVVHRTITKEDLMCPKTRQRGNEEITVYQCQVCLKILEDIKDVEMHLPKHLYLYDNEQSEYKDTVKIENFLLMNYSCKSCLLVRPQRWIRIHMWEYHFDEIQKNMDRIRATEKEIFNRPARISGNVSQDQNNFNNCIIPKDLLSKVGITEDSKTEILKAKRKQVIKEVYSCCFCPHETLFDFNRNSHLIQHKLVPNKHFYVITEVPLESLIESRSQDNTVILSCVCQHAKFSRRVLSSELLESLYAELPPRNVAPLNAEEKLSMLYKSQFIQHNKYEIFYSKVENDEKESVETQNITNETLYPTTCVDSLEIGKIRSVEIMELITKKKFIVMRNLLKKINITDKCKSSKPQFNFVPKVPEIIYSCFLCPHESMMHTKSVKNHMSKKHKLTGGYEMLLAAIPTAPLIKEKYKHPKHLSECVVIDCVCQYTVFNTDVLSLPIINTIYNNTIPEGVESNIDAKAKILQIYKRDFINHKPQNWTIQPEIFTKKSSEWFKSTESLSVLKLNQIQEIPTGTIGKVVNKNNWDKPNVSVNRTMIDVTKMVAVRDLLNKVGITRDSKYLDRETSLPQMPSQVYSCFLCPHVPMFSEVDVALHLLNKHRIKSNTPCLISAPVPIETLLDAGSENNNIVLNCPCQHAVFNEEALRSPAIDTIYDEMVSTYAYEDDEHVDAESKITKLYLLEFIGHCRYRLLLSSTGVKRQAESTGQTPKSKMYKSY